MARIFGIREQEIKSENLFWTRAGAAEHHPKTARGGCARVWGGATQKIKRASCNRPWPAGPPRHSLRSSAPMFKRDLKRVADEPPLVAEEGRAGADTQVDTQDEDAPPNSIPITTNDDTKTSSNI